MTVSVDWSTSESAIAATRFAPASDSGGKNCVKRETRMSGFARREPPPQFRGDHIHVERFGDAPTTTFGRRGTDVLVADDPPKSVGQRVHVPHRNEQASASADQLGGAPAVGRDDRDAGGHR